HLALVPRKLIIHSQRQPRLHSSQDLVEVVAVYLNEFALFHPRKRLIGLAREIADYSDDERQFLLLDCPAQLDVIRYVYSRRPDSVEFMLQAFLLRHRSLSFLSLHLEHARGLSRRLAYATRREVSKWPFDPHLRTHSVLISIYVRSPSTLVLSPRTSR